MWSREISKKQRAAWIALASVGILGRFAGGTDWLTALALGIAWVVLFLLLDGRVTENENKNSITAVQTVWNTVLLSQVMHWSSGCWPAGEATMFLPITLAVLAAASARRNAAGTVSVLFWMAAALIVPVMLSAVKELEPAWLIPEQQRGRIQLAAGYGTLLTASLLPKKEKTGAGWLAGIAMMGALIAGLTDGVLSPQMTTGKEETFYAMSRSLNLFGTVKRFESLVSTAMTLGWFALMSMLLAPMSENRVIVSIAAAICLYIINIRLPLVFVPIISVMTAISGRISWKKSKKTENNA